MQKYQQYFSNSSFIQVKFDGTYCRFLRYAINKILLKLKNKTHCISSRKRREFQRKGFIKGFINWKYIVLQFYLLQ